MRVKSKVKVLISFVDFIFSVFGECWCNLAKKKNDVKIFQTSSSVMIRAVW